MNKEKVQVKIAFNYTFNVDFLNDNWEYICPENKKPTNKKEWIEALTEPIDIEMLDWYCEEKEVEVEKG